MAVGGHFGWDDNVKFEERSLNYRANNEIVTRRGRRVGRGRGGGCVANENIIFPKTYVSREYNDRET